MQVSVERNQATMGGIGRPRVPAHAGRGRAAQKQQREAPPVIRGSTAADSEYRDEEYICAHE